MLPLSKDDLIEFTRFPSIILVKVDETGNVQAINPEVRKILGYPPEKVMGERLDSFLSPDFERKITFNPKVEQVKFQHKDGHPVWMNFVTRKCGDAYYCFGREINQEQSDDERVRLTSERLLLAVGMSEIGIFEWWPATNALCLDAAIEAIYGFKPGTMPNEPGILDRMNYPEDRPGIARGVQKAIDEHVVFTHFHRLIRADGQLRWVKCWVRPLVEADGSVRVLGAMMDITDQKLTEEEQKLLVGISEVLASSFDYVKNTHEVLRLLASHFCDFALVDHIYEESLEMERLEARRDRQTGEVKLGQKKFHRDPRTFDVSFGPVKRLYAGEVVHVPDVEALRRDLRPHYTQDFLDEIRIDGAQSFLVILLRRHDKVLGTLALSLLEGNPRKFAERDKNFIREVAYRTSMAMENSRLFISTQEAVRARDEFLSIASHELKTPLQSLTLQNGLLFRQLDRDPHDLQTIQLIRKGLESDKRQLLRLSRLIDEMLDISRIQNRKMKIELERIDFVELLRDVVNRLKPSFDAENVPLEVDAPTSIYLSVDSFRIEQVITNLLTNALRYGNHKPVKVSAHCANDSLVFKVQDHGSGITLEDQKRIFRRFERASSQKEIGGLGLGLYICKKIVEIHGGRIEIQSTPGEGATFVVLIPVVCAEP